MRPGLLELAVIVTVCVLSLLGPGLIPVKLTVWVLVSSRMVKLAKAFIVGASFTELMVNRNEVLEDNVPSLTEIVIVLVPKALVTGVIATVRLLPAPPNTIFALGTRLVLEEVAERTSESVGVSRSLILNELMAILSSLVDRLGMLE